MPLREIASADKVSLAMTEERYHSKSFASCHSGRSEESNSVQGKFHEKSHSAQADSSSNLRKLPRLRLAITSNNVTPAQSAGARKGLPLLNKEVKVKVKILSLLPPGKR